MDILGGNFVTSPTFESTPGHAPGSNEDQTKMRSRSYQDVTSISSRSMSNVYEHGACKRTNNLMNLNRLFAKLSVSEYVLYNCLLIRWRSQYGVGCRVPPGSEKIAKNREKEGKNQEKIGKERKNREGSFTLPFLTDKAGYAIAAIVIDFLLLHQRMKHVL